MKLGKRLCALVLSLVLVAGLLPVTAAAASYRDISGHWAQGDIEDAVSRGLFNGTSLTTFSPDDSMTRAMFVTVLYRMDGGWDDAPNQFRDVAPGAWYYEAVCWASECGLVTGTDVGRFSPDLNITREQMVTILYRYLLWMDAGLEKKVDSPVVFRDQSKISGYAKTAVAEMQYAGIINGKPSAGGLIFDPQGKATRAEAARVFCLFMDGMTWDWEEEIPVDSTDLEESLDYAQAEFEYAELDGQDDDGYIRLADLPGVLSKLETLAKEWMEEGFITGYEVNEDNILVRLAAGASYIHIPKVLEYKDYAANPAGQVTCYEPYYTEDKEDQSAFYDAQQKYGRVTALGQKIQQADSGYHYAGWAADSQTNLESVKQWGPNGIVLWMGHGGYSKKIGPVLFTGEFKGNEPQSVLDDLYDDVLVCTDNGRFGVTSAFFDKYYGANSLSGSLIWLGACQSHKDSRLTDVLLKKGASTVVGSSWNIYIPYLVSLTNQFFTRLTEKDSSGQFYTADAALAYAKNAAFAPTDSFFFAEMERTGSGSFRLGGVSASLTGFVTSSATNQPIPNAKITLSGSSQSATTDSAGKYTISSVSSGATYSVKAEAAGYLSAAKSVTTSTGSTGVNFSLDPVPSVSVKLSPDSGTVTKGTVTVYKLSGTSQTKVGTHSFTASSFVIGDLEAGVSYKLEIAADGFQTTSVTAKAASSPVTQIVALKELQGEIRLSLVPDSGTVTGGTVTVTKTAGLTAGTTETSSFTGSQFEIGELEPGAQYKVTIQAEGYNAATVTVTASASPAATTVALTAKTTAPVTTRTVTVNVKEYDSAASLSAAAVTLFGRATSSDSYTQIATGTTNSSGQVTYQVPSNYKLLKAEATKSGYVRGSVEDITSNSITLRLSKEPELTPSIPAGYTPIYTGEEFNALEGNEKVILMADITGVRLKNDWTGVLEGNHHSMTSQGYDPSYTHVSGLFFMENHGEIRNVRFSNVSLSGGGTVWTGVIGANGGTIENCLVSGRIAISSKGRGAAGGLVGTNYESGVIRNCVNQATVTVTVALSEDRQSTSAYAGGIAGANYGTIDHCLNLGTVSAASTNYVYVGGISAEAGAAGTCTVRDCGNGGSLSRQFNPVGNGATGGYQYALSVSATEGYATDVGGASYLKQVTLSELRTMWADVL